MFVEPSQENHSVIAVLNFCGIKQRDILRQELFPAKLDKLPGGDACVQFRAVGSRECLKAFRRVPEPLAQFRGWGNLLFPGVKRGALF